MKGKGGFTLVELLVVIAILAILGSIVVGGATMMLETARARRFTVTKEVLKTALMRYRAEYAGWPVERHGTEKSRTFTADNYEVFDALRTCNLEVDKNPDGIRFFDETAVLAVVDGKAVPLSEAPGRTGHPLGYANKSGKGASCYEVTIDFELDTVSVGPGSMVVGGDGDEY